MNLEKSYEFFRPSMLNGRVHIIGCGAIGSTVAELLCRFGVENMTLWDFDRVEAHNIANQMFRGIDIGKPKVEALADILSDINPDIREKLQLKAEGWNGERLAGYVFLAVDNIDLRRQIAEACKDNKYIKAMFDFRMRLTDAQHFAADWSVKQQIENFIGTMAFSHEEAKEETPVSACNITMSVAPTVREIVSKGVANFVNFAKGFPLKNMILSDTFAFTSVAM